MTFRAINIRVSPEKVMTNAINILQHPLWQLKDRHLISQDGRKDRVDQGKSSTLGEEVCLQSAKFCSYEHDEIFPTLFP